MNQPVNYSYLPSPIGPLLLTCEGPVMTGLYLNLHKGGPTPRPQWRNTDEPFVEARRQLDAYFAGTLTVFDLSLRLAGTLFQRRVWQELVRIPLGTTITYAQLAARIGQPGAARAVGHANGRNPISIIVPCHRVIAAGGALGGYGGGLDIKRRLLEHEQAVSAAEGHALSKAPAASQIHFSASTASRSPSIVARSGRS
jgi:methylated-DNA-[protein]-cysteine S-methyltransferase